VKRIAIIVSAIAGMLAILLWWLLCSGGPPKEAKVIQDFYAHRASFERLRDMLQADQQLQRLADWGVETDKGISKPPAGDFPMERYNSYLALLRETGGIGVARGKGVHADPDVLLWATGFAGDAVHVGVCWMDREPGRQVASLDRYYRDHKSPDGSGAIYQRIDGNWYLWTDLWSQ
jgi:RimJ/RimL family protein N-acetyltransferase